MNDLLQRFTGLRLTRVGNNTPNNNENNTPNNNEDNTPNNEDNTPNLPAIEPNRIQPINININLVPQNNNNNNVVPQNNEQQNNNVHQAYVAHPANNQNNPINPANNQNNPINQINRNPPPMNPYVQRPVVANNTRHSEDNTVIEAVRGVNWTLCGRHHNILRREFMAQITTLGSHYNRRQSTTVKRDLGFLKNIAGRTNNALSPLQLQWVVDIRRKVTEF